MEGYTDPSRYNNDPRPTEVVTKDELSKYPELGAKGVGVSKQYAGREPRFYASVAYNGSVSLILSTTRCLLFAHRIMLMHLWLLALFRWRLM